LTSDTRPAQGARTLEEQNAEQLKPVLDTLAKAIREDLGSRIALVAYRDDFCRRHECSIYADKETVLRRKDDEDWGAIRNFGQALTLVMIEHGFGLADGGASWIPQTTFNGSVAAETIHAGFIGRIEREEVVVAFTMSITGICSNQAVPYLEMKLTVCKPGKDQSILFSRISENV